MNEWQDKPERLAQYFPLLSSYNALLKEKGIIMRILNIFAVVLVLAACTFAQQDKSKRPSQPGTAEITLNGKKITVDYSRPKIADPKTGEQRKIMGDVVPYGKVWRTGANEATTLKTEADLDVDGKTVPAGTYTLFTLPESDKWTLIISKKTGEWGIPYPGETNDLARVPMNVEHLQQTVDPFTITLTAGSGNSQAKMCVAWETTQACVNLTAK